MFAKTVGAWHSGSYSMYSQTGPHPTPKSPTNLNIATLFIYLFENLCHTFYLFENFIHVVFLFQGDCGGAEEYRWHLAQIIKEVNNHYSYTPSTPQYIPQGTQYIFYHCPSLPPQPLSPITVHSPTLGTHKYIPPKPS